MAQAILTEVEWKSIEARALDLFTTRRNLEWDDSLIAAMCEQRAPAATTRALNLIEKDGGVSFSIAFKAVRMTDRYFDDEPMPMKHAA